MSTHKTLGMTLRKARQAAELTLDDVVQKLKHEGIPKLTTTISYLSRLESDRAVVREPILRALAALYSLNLSDLLELLPNSVAKQETIAIAVSTTKLENRALSDAYSRLGEDMYNLGEVLYEQFNQADSLEAYLAARKLFAISERQSKLRETLYRIGASYLTLASNEAATQPEIASLARKSIESLSQIYTGELASIDRFVYSGKSVDDYLASATASSLPEVVLYGSALGMSARAHYILAQHSTDKTALRIAIENARSAALIGKWVIDNITDDFQDAEQLNAMHLDKERLLASTHQKLAILIREMENPGAIARAGLEQYEWSSHMKTALSTQLHVTQRSDDIAKDVKLLAKYHETYSALLDKPSKKQSEDASERASLALWHLLVAAKLDARFNEDQNPDVRATLSRLLHEAGSPLKGILETVHELDAGGRFVALDYPLLSMKG